MTNEYIRPWTRDTNQVQKAAHITTLTCMPEPYAADYVYGGPKKKTLQPPSCVIFLTTPVTTV